MDFENSRFFIMRHGETNSNLSGVWQCYRDEPLNQTGVRQATEVSAIVRQINPDVVITSNLQRTINTARIALGGLDGIQHIVDPALNERKCGDIEGLDSQQIMMKFGFHMRSILCEELDQVRGAEALSIFRNRISYAIENAYSNFQGKKVLIVSHGGVMRAFYNANFGSLPDGIVFRNCSIISLGKNEGTWRLLGTHNTVQI